MAVTNKIYGKAWEYILGEYIDWGSDTIKCALLSASYTPNQDIDITWASVEDYLVGTAATMANCSVDWTSGVFKLDADDTVIGVVNDAFRYGVVYDSTSGILIALVDCGETINPAGAVVTMQWHGDGIVRVDTVPHTIADDSRVSNVTAITEGVIAQYGRFEISFDVTTSATNLYVPYDADPPAGITAEIGITVDLLVSNDNWATTLTVPCFYYQDYSSNDVSGVEYNTPVGLPEWRARFAPTDTGIWRYKIRVTDANGTHTTGAGYFACDAGSYHGFPQAAASDSRYFETTDGTLILSANTHLHEHDYSSIDAVEHIENNLKDSVKIVRWWITSKRYMVPFGGGDNGRVYPQWTSNNAFDITGGANGDLFSLRVGAGKNYYQSLYLTAGTTYTLTGYVKKASLSGGSASYAYIGTATTTITGSEYDDWKSISIDFTPGSSGVYNVGVDNNASSGNIYFDNFSVKTISSGEYLSKGDFEFYKYVDQRDAWRVDTVFKAGEDNGVYFAVVIQEYKDYSFGCLNDDGTAEAYSVGNVYAKTNSVSRWYQKAWWRYAAARWGAYRSLHSFEQFNEADPGPVVDSAGAWDAADAMAEYIHDNYPRNIMCSTSFWHSTPMEFWKNSECDYINLHEYFGSTNAGTMSNGSRLYAWFDQPTTKPDDELPFTYTNAVLSIDNSVARTGSKSVKIVMTNGYEFTAHQFHLGIDPTHTYTLKYYAKGNNIANPGGGLSWTRASIMIVWSKAYHANDYISNTKITANLGTYDWTLFQNASITPPATANTANITFCAVGDTVNTGTIWFDDIEFIDNTTGKSWYISGSFEEPDGRIDYDPVLAMQKYGDFLHSYGQRIDKPVYWGETGIRDSTGENAELASDTAGVHIKKMIWMHLYHHPPYLNYYWDDNIVDNNLWGLFTAFQTFISDIPLNNGHYVDAAATCDNADIRVIGQKDLTNNKAHIWVDNKNHTWKNVVDEVSIDAESGTVTITGLANGDYHVNSYNTSTGALIYSDTITADGSGLDITITDLATDVAYKIIPA